MATDDAKRALAELWEQVLARWDEAALHDAALELARASAQLPELAARYRAVKDDAGAPESRRELATKRLAAIALVAMNTLDASRSTPRAGPPRWLTIVVAVASVLVSLWAAKQVLRP
ncbi:MAG: hypothetical protein IT374_13285 [Polyangiaceae bacterium]|nr:hypothetical protein [Polyangiaceae bacterium]